LLPRGSCLFSLDHPVRSRQHIRRYRKADLLRSFQIDYELKLRRLLHRKICWFSALQNLVHVGSSPPPQVHHIRRIGHEPSVLHILYLVVYRRQPALCREFYNLCSVDKEDRTAQQEKSVNMPFTCVSECSLNILGTSYLLVL